ncbi:MAG: hypothetical protein KatS3mg103_0705 [Phycisphaerales bacterium]|nr:MAG: hypothetical protein KatS3mg103_0705 [Phycisphaerales bacterium]
MLSERPTNDLFGRLSGRGDGQRVGPPGQGPAGGAAEATPIRQTLPTGEVVLRSRSARDLMAHLRHALTAPDPDAEAELFLAYLLSERTQREFLERGLEPRLAYDELRRRREDCLRFFSRVGPLGERSPQVLLRMVGQNVMRLQLTGLAKEDLAWTYMDMVYEGGNWKLRWFGPS